MIDPVGNLQRTPLKAFDARAGSDPDKVVIGQKRTPRSHKKPPTLAAVLSALGVDTVTDVPPSALLDRHQLAALLTALGLKITHATLESWASTGRGPLYRKWGSVNVRYQWADAQSWAASRLSEPLASAAAHRTRFQTRELQLQRPAPATAQRRPQTGALT
jgi:hypothetical protein